MEPTTTIIFDKAKLIIRDDMFEKLFDDYKYCRPKPKDMEYLMQLVKLAHYVAEFCNFPNNTLIDLTKKCQTYYENFGSE